MRSMHIFSSSVNIILNIDRLTAFLAPRVNLVFDGATNIPIDLLGHCVNAPSSSLMIFGPIKGKT